MNKNVLKLIITFILLYLALGVFFPYNAKYLEESLHFNGIQIGLFYSLSALMVAFLVPFMGMIADNIKSPKIIFMLCAIVSGILIIPYIYSRSFILVSILYIIIHGFRSSLTPLMDTITIDYSAQNNINFGKIRLIGSFAFIIGSLLMGYCLTKFNNNPNLFLYAHFLLLVLAGISVLFQKNHYHIHKSNNSFIKDINLLIKNRQFVIVIIIMGLSYAIIQVSQSYVALSIIDLKGDNNIIGISFFFMVIPEVLLFGVVLHFLKKASHMVLMGIGIILLLIRWIVLLISNSILLLLIVSSTHGLIMAFVIIVGFDLIKKIVPAYLLSSSMSLYTGLANIFFAITSILAGLLMNNGNIKNTYFLYIFTTLLVLGVIIYYNKHYRRRHN